MQVIFMPQHQIWQMLQCAHILSMSMHFHTGNVYCDAMTMCTYPQSEHALPHWKCVWRCCDDCPYINIPDQETTKKNKEKQPQLGFTFITSLDIVLLMVEFH